MSALCAPVLFSSVMEFPLALVLACLLLPWAPGSGPRQRLLDGVVLVAVGIAYFALPYVLNQTDWEVNTDRRVAALLLPPCLLAAGRPPRLALCLGAIPVPQGAWHAHHRTVLFQGRSFFGICSAWARARWLPMARRGRA